MEKLNIILFGLGFVIVIIALVAMVIRITNGKKVGVLLPFVLIWGFISIGSGMGLTLIQTNSTGSIAKVLDSNTNKTTKDNKTSVNVIDSSKSNSTKDSQTKNFVFDSSGSVVPKKSMDMWGNETFIDADGSKSVGGILFTPQGIRYRMSSEGAIVEIPTGKTSAEGKIYTQYTYLINNLDGEIWVTSGNLAFMDENKSDQVKDLGGGKIEKYPPNQGYEMKYVDFIYKYIPVAKPQKTIDNDFLSGMYAGKQENILSTKTTITLQILDDKLLSINCDYISDMNSIFGYKLEPLGKNAYKMYLYPATVKADTNGGGANISDEPLKRTFLIYMKSKDSFDIVFTSDDIRRTSISMDKQ